MTAPERPQLLDVDDLTVDVVTDVGRRVVLDAVSFGVGRAEVVGLVGESGSGKTMTGLALMRLLPHGAQITGGRVDFDGLDLPTLAERDIEDLRGDRISMIFQEPMASLNPVFTVGDQIAETFRRHRGGGRRAASTRAVDLLDRVGIPDPGMAADRYPHEFSGGMAQRAMIAMALACEPELLIADEPTTALDVTIQAQVLDLLRAMSAELHMAVLFITHDLGVVADLCDRVLVMYAGQVVEDNDVWSLYDRPLHPYTEGLMHSMPQLDGMESDRALPAPDPSLAPVATTGCRFAPRCRYAVEECVATGPSLERACTGGRTRCLRWQELTLAGAGG